MTVGLPATGRGKGRLSAVTNFPSTDTGARIARPRKSQEVTRDDMEIVSALCSALASRVGQDRYELWFRRSVAFQVKGGLAPGSLAPREDIPLAERADHIVYIAVAEAFRLEYVRRTFRTDIAACAVQVLGGQPAIEFRLDPSLADAPPASSEKEQSAPAAAVTAQAA